MNAWTVLGAVVIVVAATWAHYLFWSRHYRLPLGADEVIHAETPDGWRLALSRRRPRGGAGRGAPVLLVHGIAANHTALDFGIERWSLSAHLAAAGFDCFALDLRGHGLSRPLRRVRRTWSFDDYVRLDLPAALDAVRVATGAPAVHWVGHSQGALLGMAACALYPERVASLVALGAPTSFGAESPLRLLARLGFLFTGRLNRFLARSLAPVAGVWHAPVSEIAINGRNVTRPVYRRVLANVVENVSPGVLRQFGRWIATDTFAALDGAVDYRQALGQCRQPALFVAADGDRIAPPQVVEASARAWGGEATVIRIGVAGSATCDYGHSDLLFGRAAPEDVFPRVRDWLLALAARGAPAAAPRGREAAPGSRA